MIRVSVAYSPKPWVPKWLSRVVYSVFFVKVSPEVCSSVKNRSGAMPELPVRWTREEFEAEVEKTLRWVENQGRN